MSKETGVKSCKIQKDRRTNERERERQWFISRPTNNSDFRPSLPSPSSLSSPFLLQTCLGGESEVCSLSIINVCVRSSSYCSSTKGCLNIYWLRWELTGWIEKCKKKNEFRTKLVLFFEGTRHGRRAIVSVSFIFHVSPKIKSINIQRSIQATNKNRNYEIGEVL